jgi:hypothetical protein
MSDKKRLQFDFTEEGLRELDELQEATGLPTRAELIRHALRLLQWTIEETANKGATLLLEKEGRIREVVFPFWGRAASSQSRSGADPVSG